MERMVADLAAQRSGAEALDEEIKTQLVKMGFEL
jgi:hypothetical protein